MILLDVSPGSKKRKQTLILVISIKWSKYFDPSMVKITTHDSTFHFNLFIRTLQKSLIFIIAIFYMNLNEITSYENRYEKQLCSCR